MPPVRKALVGTALREDAEKVVFRDREGRAPRPTRRRPPGLCLDRGYDYDEVRALAEEFGFTCHIRSRGEERALKREAGFRARRWVVGRTHEAPVRVRGLSPRTFPAKRRTQPRAKAQLSLGVLLELSTYIPFARTLYSGRGDGDVPGGDPV